MSRVARGDEHALETLLRETYALIFSTAMRITSSWVDAEDVAAGVYFRAWRTAGAFDARRGSVGAWLVSMARSAALDRLRARAVRSRTELASSFQANRADDPAAAIDASQRRNRLEQALSAIPFEQRRAIELFYFSDLAVPDIAAKLGHPMGTVKTRLRLGIRRLRRELSAPEFRANFGI